MKKCVIIHQTTWNKWKNYHTPCVKVLSHQRQHEKEVLSSKHTNLYVPTFSLVEEKEDTIRLDE